MTNGSREILTESREYLLRLKNSEAEKELIKRVLRSIDEGVLEVPKPFKRLTKAKVRELGKELDLKEMADYLANMGKSNYRLIGSREELKEAKELLMASEYIAFDVETTGVEFEDTIVAHVLSCQERHFVILDEKEYREDLIDIYQGTSRKIAHNAPFDLLKLLMWGVEVKNFYWDTMEAQKLINENEDSFQLKVLANKYIDPSLKGSYKDFFGNSSFADTDINQSYKYAARDGDITYRLFLKQKEFLEKNSRVLNYYLSIERPLAMIVARMQAHGVKVLSDEVAMSAPLLLEKERKLEAQIKRDLGDININSPVQLKAVFSKLLNKKLASVDKKTLKKYKSNRTVEAFLEYRKLNKLNSTYVAKLINKRRIHAPFNQNGAKTGRFSSGGGGINLQNQPQESRKWYGPDPDTVWVSLDFKAQEIRAAASLSQEPKLIQAFKEKRDPYASMASVVLNRPYEEVNKNPDGTDTAERKKFKVVWLATLYGMHVRTLKDLLGVSEKEAARIQKELFDNLPRLATWVEDRKKEALKTGKVEMVGGFRARHLPLAVKGSHWEKEAAKRQAPNAVIQGSSAIQSKAVMVRMDKLCQLMDYRWKLLLAIHDELVIQMPIEDANSENLELIKKTMTSVAFKDVETATDVEICTNNWAESISAEEFLNRRSKNDL